MYVFEVQVTLRPMSPQTKPTFSYSKSLCITSILTISISNNTHTTTRSGAGAIAY